ncbi:ROK family protein [Sphingomonas paeninsulae]|uniref:ROK family protein n=1 Tax=Sphingomonas paeninsulae TaxID=2319844 RepID=UPI00196939BF|nr:ROK family protein [Sphingomonas paeninsulae]
MIGAVELGGTKINVAVGTGPGDLRATARIPTTSPDQTLQAVIAFFRAQPPVSAVGIGSFGPVNLNRADPAWGSITKTPKPGWAHTPVAVTIADALGMPVAFDTDVNAAALAEYRWGALADCQTGLYLTVGTGIGGGVIIDGRPHHGLIHPEMGHIRVKRALGDNFPGVCAFHGDCAEGLASGPAIEARLGASLSKSAPDDPRRVHIFDTLGQALANYLFTLSPDRIVVGGACQKHRVFTRHCASA